MLHQHKIKKEVKHNRQRKHGIDSRNNSRIPVLHAMPLAAGNSSSDSQGVRKEKKRTGGETPVKGSLSE